MQSTLGPEFAFTWHRAWAGASCLSAQLVSSGSAPNWRGYTTPGSGAVSMLYSPCCISGRITPIDQMLRLPHICFWKSCLFHLFTCTLLPPESFGDYFLIVMASKLFALDPPHGRTLSSHFPTCFPAAYAMWVSSYLPNLYYWDKETLPLHLITESVAPSFVGTRMFVHQMARQANHSSSSKAVVSFPPTQTIKKRLLLPAKSAFL